MANRSWRKMDIKDYKNKRVLITGHTGFKGSWLSEILLMAGAEVHGFALKPETKPALFSQLRLAHRIASHTIGDIRDAEALLDAVRRMRPQFIFHLAAQPLVRRSYREPAETFAANVMGTVNLLDACRQLALPCSIVCITTDKCYENDNSGRPFRETDPMGGADPYSASKGACEIALASYRRSFFSAPDSPVRVASARAGNVIGGGDWAEDRIVPDAMRAFLKGKTLVVRNKRATRPWQHVLEPLSGYLALALALDRPECRSAFNFGPSPATVRTVDALAKRLAVHFPNAVVEHHADPSAPAEARLLQLDSTKAAVVLGWKPRWDFARTVDETAAWYSAVARGESPRAVTDAQIERFFA